MQTNNDFLATSDSRETSIEILEAINAIATHTPDLQRIWEAPEEAELLAIWETVTKNGLTDASSFSWGYSGSEWADSVL